jgi:hypothetical protein
MMRILKLLTVVSLSCVPISLPAQTIRAASCNFADVQNAWANVTASTTTFVIPAGTCTWTNATQVNLKAPSGSTTLTIQGSGSATGSDSLGNPTGYNDQTIIIFQTAITPLNITGASTQTLLRITGITFEANSGSPVDSNGYVAFDGGPTNVPFLRVDHNHFWDNGGPNTLMGIVYTSIGVFDHNLFDLPFNGVTNGIRVWGGGQFGDSAGMGNGDWSNATQLGTNLFLFFEDNTFNNAYANDCNTGGRQVFRYNTFNASLWQTHEMEGDQRGCRATEAYKNVFNGNPSANNIAGTGSWRTGTGVSWGNTVRSYTNYLSVNNDRTNGHLFGTTPGDWGYCGTQGVYPGPSGWDGNSDSTGWPCLDQPGRGQSDVLTGSFPTKCDATTGCTTNNGTWPHNLREPIYEWMDNLTSVTYTMGNPSPGGALLQNRDYYQETFNQSAQTSPSSPFNGTTGTGHGTLANRPTTCTAGPGGTFGASPTGSFGVAYWATDANSGNGELYVCTATNTWTAYYTPYTYPHPLAQGASSSASTVVAPPSGLTATVN